MPPRQIDGLRPRGVGCPRNLVLLAASIQIVLGASAIGAQSDDVDRIRVLLVGQVTPEYCSAPGWFDSEPIMEYILVPTKLIYVMRLEEARRFVRLYFPRSRKAIESYDFQMFINPYFEPFTPAQIENMRLAILETGRSAFQTLGGLTIDWLTVNWFWVISTLAHAFPNDPMEYDLWNLNKKYCLPGYTQDLGGGSYYRVQVSRDPSLPPVLTMFLPLGIEQVRGYGAIVIMTPEQGSRLWASAIGAYPALAPTVPWLLSWDYGEGTTWSVADDIDCPWWSGTLKPSEQKYGFDILMNIVLWTLGEPLPEDIVLVNWARQGFQAYQKEGNDMLVLLDFVERFGANTNVVLREKTDLDAVVEAAKIMHLNRDYQGALEETKQARRQLVELQKKAINLKDNALFWVYVIEWAVVSATSLLTGLTIYYIMVKRRVYREVGLTRLAQLAE
jgi:hypothetical protein